MAAFTAFSLKKPPRQDWTRTADPVATKVVQRRHQAAAGEGMCVGWGKAPRHQPLDKSRHQAAAGEGMCVGWGRAPRHQPLDNSRHQAAAGGRYFAKPGSRMHNSQHQQSTKAGRRGVWGRAPATQVRVARLELARLSAPDPKSGLATNYNTPAGYRRKDTNYFLTRAMRAAAAQRSDWATR